ncbi:MAG TPA: formylmethanofuran dehydrogenase [Methanothermobacter sp.]|nr:formylmethanofuran dehydrogenase [Methanothermobacter sp.]
MENEKEKHLKVLEFHGHSCPGVAIGVRAAEIATDKLISSRAVDEELLAIVENDSCSVDAIQVITGCTFGKGNLIFKDHGKNVYTFVYRDSGKALRLSLNVAIDGIDPEFAEVRTKAFAGEATPEDQKLFDEKKDVIFDKIINMPEDELFKIEFVDIEIPEKARIFGSVKCSKCGELVAEHRARVENSEFVCIPCFDDYSRN